MIEIWYNVLIDERVDKICWQVIGAEKWYTGILEWDSKMWLTEIYIVLWQVIVEMV